MLLRYCLNKKMSTLIKGGIRVLKSLLVNNPDYKILSRDKLMTLLRKKGFDINTKVYDEHFKSSELDQVFSKKNTVKKQPMYKITAAPYSFQIDIVMLPAYKKSNKGVNSFFLAIEILSRKAFAYPLCSNKMESVIQIYETSFIKDAKKAGASFIRSVSGDDFFDNKAFKIINKKHNIPIYTTVAKDDHVANKGNKLGIIDRATRTIKRYIQKYMNENKTVIWTQFLSNIITLYNNSPHSFNGDVSPNDVYNDYEVLMNKYREEKSHNRMLSWSLNLEVGQKVRTLKKKAKFEKEGRTWSSEIFTIVRKEGYRYCVTGEDGIEVKYNFRHNELIKVEPEKIAKRISSDKIKKAGQSHKQARRLQHEEGVCKTFTAAVKKIKSVNTKQAKKTVGQVVVEKHQSKGKSKAKKRPPYWMSSNAPAEQKRKRTKANDWWVVEKKTDS